MEERSETILTNMVMLYRADGSFLVQNRLAKDWPGLNFPGGHVRRYESLEEAAARELLEETGLVAESLEQVGVYEWNVPEQNLRHVAILYRSCHFHGTLFSSEEGPMLWIKKAELPSHPLSVDFEKVLRIMSKGLSLD